MANVKQDEWVARVLGILAAGALDGATTAGRDRARSDVPRAAGGAVAYAKGRLDWLAMRQKVDREFEAFIDSVAEQYEDGDDEAEVRGLLRSRLSPVLAVLDDELADKLDEAGNETDGEKRGRLVGEARAIIERYQAYVAGEEMLAAMDSNPFAPTAIQANMTETLQALSAAIR